MPRQLPAAVPHFTGRAAELDALTKILDEAASTSAPGTLVISAIKGTAGIGKTALALHWAHQVAHRFPDGQLHVNLRGFDPSGTPMAPAEAIRGFLDALGVPAEEVPRDTGAQASLYRSLLADRRMLIVLDNARDEQQVRPLLPASADALVLITSRSQVIGLAAAEGARLITLDTLTRDEAIRMLTARIGQRRAADDPAAVREIAALCAYLPLALSVVAARVSARPRFHLAALAAELRDTADRLDALDLGDPQSSVEAVFSWSNDQLSPEAARMFRLLGLYPGPDISTEASARLADVDRAGARRQLRELDRRCLITEHAPGRYAFHDLLRAYAARQARIIDGQAETAAALGRVLDYYAQTACTAALTLYPSREMSTFAAERPGYDVVKGRFGEGQQARAWLDAEHSNLIAAVTSAAEFGFDHHTWQIPWFLGSHLSRCGYWNERVDLQRNALAAATRLEDIAGQAVSSRLLGGAYLDIDGNYDQVIDCFQASADLYRQIGDRLGEAKASARLAIAVVFQGRYTEADAHFQRVLRLQRELGHNAGEAQTLLVLGMIRGSDGDVSETLEFARQALTLAKESGNQYIEEFAWHNIGYCQQVLGSFAEATTGFQHSLVLARKAGDRFHEADILAHLGDLHHSHGNARRAEETWSQALTIFDEIQHPDGDHVRAKLARPGPPGSDLSIPVPVLKDPATNTEPARFPRCSLAHRSAGKRLASDTVQLRRPSL